MPNPNWLGARVIIRQTNKERIMDTNIIYFLVAVPVLLIIIIWFVLYSRKQQQQDISQTSIKRNESRAEEITG
jgi:hypothetical protein